MFKLNIECTKDIDFLKINFADGTSSVISSPEKLVKQNKRENDVPKETKIEKRADYLPADGDSNYMYKTNEKVKLPEIKETNRPVKVANELQNLDF